MRTRSAILGLAAALALSGAAIGSAHASPMTSGKTISGGPGPITSGDLTFSDITYSDGTTASQHNYTLVPGNDVTSTNTSSPYDGLVFTPNKSWEVTSKSKTVNVQLSYKVSATGNNLIDDADLHFAGVTKTTEKVVTTTYTYSHGQRHAHNHTTTKTVKVGTIKDTETVTFKTTNGKTETVKITADTPSHSIDKTLSHEILVKSIDVVQDIVLHATQSADLYVKLANFTDEFSTKNDGPTPVPEPGSLGLLGIGLAGLGLLASKRRKRQA